MKNLQEIPAWAKNKFFKFTGSSKPNTPVKSRGAFSSQIDWVDSEVRSNSTSQAGMSRNGHGAKGIRGTADVQKRAFDVVLPHVFSSRATNLTPIGKASEIPCCEDTHLAMLIGRQLLLTDSMSPAQCDVPSEAFEILLKAQEKNPDDANIAFWLGQAARLCYTPKYRKLEPFKIAMTCFSKVVVARPDDRTARLFYALAVLEDMVHSAQPSESLGEWVKDTAKETLSANKDHILGNLIFAYCERLFSRNDDAVDLMEGLASRVPSNPLVLCFLLALYEESIDRFLQKRCDSLKSRTAMQIVSRMEELIAQIKALDADFYEADFCLAKLYPGSVDHSSYTRRQRRVMGPLGLLESPLTFLDLAIDKY